MLQTRIPVVRAPRFVRHAPTRGGQGSRALLMVMLPFALGLAGCEDNQSPTAPFQDDRHLSPTTLAVAELPTTLAAGKAPTKGPATAAVAIEDALARVLPALEAGGPTAALDEGLRQLHAQLERGGAGDGLERALGAVQQAVDMYQAAAGVAFRPDIGVVQLALDEVARR